MERKFYKSEDGEVYEFASDGSEDDFITPNLIRMSEEEVFLHLNPSPIPLTKDEVEAQRLRAYADPISGSDRYFAEASRLQAMGASQEEVDAAKTAGASRYAEIQSQYPWPVS